MGGAQAQSPLTMASAQPPLDVGRRALGYGTAARFRFSGFLGDMGYQTWCWQIAHRESARPPRGGGDVAGFAERRCDPLGSGRLGAASSGPSAGARRRPGWRVDTAPGGGKLTAAPSSPPPRSPQLPHGLPTPGRHRSGRERPGRPLVGASAAGRRVPPAATARPPTLPRHPPRSARPDDAAHRRPTKADDADLAAMIPAVSVPAASAGGWRGC